ncbi:MAG TPA: hypothetical protein DHW42_09970 [Candidatus Marinimicrobia bacterium]|nr:hypothetical protein [Candidatus Neomarinimicrobiota bacterium]
MKPLGLNIILGHNQVGKSAIRDAMRYALTGSARGMNNRAGQDHLIKHGANKAEVEIEIDGMEILRTTNNRLAINGINKQMKSGQQEILDGIGVSAETLSMLFDTYKISKMDALERRKYFSKIFQVQTSDEEFADLLRKNRIEQRVIALSMPSFSSGGLKSIYDLAVEKRRQLKRDLSDLENKQDPESVIDVEGESIDLKKVNAGAIVDNITALSRELGKLRTEKETVQNRAIENERREREVGRCESNLKKLNKYLKVNKEQFENQQKIAAELKVVNQKHAEMRDEHDRIVAEIDNTIMLLGIVKKLDLCESCDRKLSGEFNDKLNNLSLEKDKRLLKVGEVREHIKNLECGLEDDIRVEYQSKANDVKSCETDLEQARAAYEGDTKDDVFVLESKIKQMESTISRKKLILYKIEEYNRAKSGFISIGAEINTVTTEIENWDKLAKFVNPESSNLVNPIYKQLAERIEYTSSLFNSDITVDENTWDICYKNVPLEFCSTSEKYEAGIVIQDAVSYLLGIGILFLDGVEIFVGEKKVEFSHAVKQLSADYNNIFMFASVKDRPVISGNGVNYIWVDSGKVEMS